MKINNKKKLTNFFFFVIDFKNFDKYDYTTVISFAITLILHNYILFVRINLKMNNKNYHEKKRKQKKYHHHYFIFVFFLFVLTNYK